MYSSEYELTFEFIGIHINISIDICQLTVFAYFG